MTKFMTKNSKKLTIVISMDIELVIKNFKIKK